MPPPYPAERSQKPSSTNETWRHSRVSDSHSNLIDDDALHPMDVTKLDIATPIHIFDPQAILVSTARVVKGQVQAAEAFAKHADMSLASDNT